MNDPYLDALREYETAIAPAHETIRRARERLWAALDVIHEEPDVRIEQAFLQHADPTEPNGAEFALAIPQPGQDSVALVATPEIGTPAPAPPSGPAAARASADRREDVSRPPVSGSPVPAFACPHCARSFDTDHKRRIHLGRMHKGQAKPPRAELHVSTSEPPLPIQRPHSCHRCSERFATRVELEAHRIAAKHGLPVGRAADPFRIEQPTGGGALIVTCRTA
jgi:hypothetical protein